MTADTTEPDELDDDGTGDAGDDDATAALGTLAELIRTAVREEVTAAWAAAQQPPKSSPKRKPAPKPTPAPEPEKPPTILDQLAGLFRT